VNGTGTGKPEWPLMATVRLKRKASTSAWCWCGVPLVATQRIASRLTNDAAQWFSQVDQNGTGTIDAKELQQALSLGSLNFSLQITNTMIK
jgi:Ca2+-binding EF-hand superfamily protein